MRKKKLILNTGSALINQLVLLLSNFIIPRQIILVFGSEVNGLVTSITQFLGFIALTEMGIGAVVQSALYKPLSVNDHNQVSKILKSARNFFNKIGFTLIIYIVLLCAFYPYISKSSFSHVYTIPLILAISINLISQYYFGIVNQLLLNADQNSYVHLSLNAISIVINTIATVLLIKCNYSIQFVKLVSSLVLLLKPIGMSIYVKKHYKIQRNVSFQDEPIGQKWNGIAQHVAAFVLSHTDVAVLTLFAGFINVSIYNVYCMVVAGVRQLITTSLAGVDALFGNLYATKDKNINKYFDAYEWIIHTLVTFIFTCTSVLICPFVKIYTVGVKDANYIFPLFGIMITAAYAMYTIRLPYNTMVLAAGHYKETQTSAIIEALLNVSISIILVKSFGLIGVAVGTFIAMLYRTIYLAYYLSKAILFRSLSIFIKRIFIDLLLVVVIYFSTIILQEYPNNYLGWGVLAIKIVVIAILEILLVNLLFYRNEMKLFISILKKKKTA